MISKENFLSFVFVIKYFNLDNDEHKDTPPTTFSFNGVEFDDLSTPAWVKAAMEVEKEMK